MKDRSATCKQMTLPGFNNSTHSLELPGGQLPCDKQVGQKKSQFSQGHAHARQRLYWYARYVGDTGCPHGKRWQEAERPVAKKESKRRKDTVDAVPHGVPERVANSKARRERPLSGKPRKSVRQEEPTGRCGVSGRMADRSSEGLEGWEEQSAREKQPPAERGSDAGRSRPTNGHWRSADWVFCRDDKWRPVDHGSSPLAYGIPHRTSKMRTWIRFMGFGSKISEKVLRLSKAIIQDARASRNGQLSGYGNAIVIPQAVEFIRACMEEFDD